MTREELIIKNIEDQMRHSEMQAYWWMRSADNGVAVARDLCTVGGKPFTDQAKIKSAMNTAQDHMHRFREL